MDTTPTSTQGGALLPPELVATVPTDGVVIQEETLTFVLCKPKLLPMKSITIEKLEKLQKAAQDKAKQQINDSKG